METPEPDATSSNAATGAGPAAEPATLRTLRGWMRDLFFSILVTLFIILFVYQPVKVDGGSMEPGLEDQERIFINKLAYRFESIERGDIVVFHNPRDPEKSFIKRVIGLPGDRIRIDFGRVFVNGRQLQEPYVPPDYQDAQSYPDTVVPDNAYFVLGDHRSMSNDSRKIGPVMRSFIYGKAVFGYWPMEKLGFLH
ncbi:MAG TPA: signal peptidase I [Candidatus Angelobacter sp.]|nr:signal peptidase I [Candidatus Angelobacter sp.]